MILILYPFKMFAEYENREYIEFGGFDEEDCMYRILDHKDIYGELFNYGYVNNEDYYDGKLVPDNPA